MRIPVKRVGLMAVAAILVTAASAASARSRRARGPGAITIGFSVPAVDDYYGVVRDSFVAAAEAQGLSYFEGNGDGAADPTQQIANVDTMLAQGIDVLAIAPPGDAFRPVLDRRQGARREGHLHRPAGARLGRRVHLHRDRQPDRQPAAGRLSRSQLEAGDQVGIMIGIPGIPLLFDRYNNFKTTLEAAGIEVTCRPRRMAASSTRPSTSPATSSWRTPTSTPIYSLCGPTGVAVTQVLQEQGNPALSLTWDVPVQEINDILEGKATAAVAQFPQRLGENAVAYALKVAAGEERPRLCRQRDGDRHHRQCGRVLPRRHDRLLVQARIACAVGRGPGPNQAAEATRWRPPPSSERRASCWVASRALRIGDRRGRVGRARAGPARRGSRVSIATGRGVGIAGEGGTACEGRGHPPVHLGQFDRPAVDVCRDPPLGARLRGPRLRLDLDQRPSAVPSVGRTAASGWLVVPGTVGGLGGLDLDGGTRRGDRACRDRLVGALARASATRRCWPRWRSRSTRSVPDA